MCLLFPPSQNPAHYRGGGREFALFVVVVAFPALEWTYSLHMQGTDMIPLSIRCQTTPTPSHLPRSTHVLHIALLRSVRVQAIKARRTLHLLRCGIIKRPRASIVLLLPNPGLTCRWQAEAVSGENKTLEGLKRSPGATLPIDIFSCSPFATIFSLMFKYILCNTFSHAGVNLMHAIECKCLFGFGSI